MAQLSLLRAHTHLHKKKPGQRFQQDLAAGNEEIMLRKRRR